VIRGSEFAIAITHETWFCQGRINQWIYDWIYRAGINLVNPSITCSSFPLIRNIPRGDLVDLIELKHRSILIVDSWLRQVRCHSIWVIGSISAKIGSLVTVTSNRTSFNFYNISQCYGSSKQWRTRWHDLLFMFSIVVGLFVLSLRLHFCYEVVLTDSCRISRVPHYLGYFSSWGSVSNTGFAPSMTGRSRPFFYTAYILL
jgi:hypothetical protein